MTKKRALAHTETKGLGIKNVLSTLFGQICTLGQVLPQRKEEKNYFKNYFY